MGMRPNRGTTRNPKPDYSQGWTKRLKKELDLLRQAEAGGCMCQVPGGGQPVCLIHKQKEK